jgi:hypothetical protein
MELRNRMIARTDAKEAENAARSRFCISDEQGSDTAI